LTYAAQWLLTYDDPFVSRCRACTTVVATSKMTDATQLLARDLLSGQNNSARATFQEVLGGIPELINTADNGDGTIDSSLITDDQIRTQVERIWPDIYDLFYGGGTPPPLAGVEVTDVAPKSGAAGRNITITGVGLTGATLVNIGYDCTNLVVVSDTQLTAVTANPKPPQGYYPVLVTVAGTVYTGPDYQVT